MIRRGRFAPPPRCLFARCVLLRTRRLSAAVCLEATGRGEIRWGVEGGSQMPKQPTTRLVLELGFGDATILIFIHLNAIIFTLIIVVFHEKKYPKIDCGIYV